MAAWSRSLFIAISYWRARLDRNFAVARFLRARIFRLFRRHHHGPDLHRGVLCCGSSYSPTSLGAEHFANMLMLRINIDA